MEKQPTCKERVRAHYTGRMADLHRLWKAYQRDEEENVKDLGNIFDYGLAFDYVPADTFDGQRRGYFRYQLSCGGPSEEFRFYCDETKTPQKVEFWFLDWFDGAKITAQGRNLGLLMEIFGWLNDGGTVDRVMEDSIQEERK